MRRLMMLFIFLTGILLFMTTAHAAPFIYNESSGDLEGSLPAPTVFPFEIGVNSVLGTTYFDGSVGDWDCFAFSIPSGMQVTFLVGTQAISGTSPHSPFPNPLPCFFLGLV